jgi:hypothetical protein
MREINEDFFRWFVWPGDIFPTFFSGIFSYFFFGDFFRVPKRTSGPGHYFLYTITIKTQAPFQQRNTSEQIWSKSQ